MGRSFFTFSALIGFLSGVLVYPIFRPEFYVLLIIIFLCILFLFFKGRMPRFYAIAAVFIISFCFGIMRAEFSEHRKSESQIDFYNGQKVEVEGIITETDVRRDKAKYTIRVEYVSNPSVSEISESRLRSAGDVLISTNKYPQYEYGDRVELTGKLEEPGEFDGFSYSDYLSRYGIYSVMYHPKIRVTGKGEGNFFWRCMSYLQNGFSERINQMLPEPYASFEAGLLVGSRRGIPDDLMIRFNITGLTHIIAISGFNITIIIVSVMWMLKRLPRKIGYPIAIGAIIIFTLFVGASPAVVRASIMGVLGLIALNNGRQNNIHLTILFTAFFMIFWNPKILWFDAGFQLSFAAVLGLIYVAPLFKKYSDKLPEALGIREAITMTMSAQVMAMPIILYNFGRLSLIAPISNLVVAFAIPPAMLFGFLGVIFSFLPGGIGMIFGYITWGILAYIIKAITLMSDIPYASVNMPKIGIWIAAVYYSLLCLGIIQLNRNTKSDENL